MHHPVSEQALSTIAVRAWEDPLVEAVGFGPRSDYVEHCWLPVLGPSATWCYRRLGTLVLAHPGDTVEVDPLDLSLCLGLGHGLGHSSTIARTLARLAHFGVICQDARGMAVRRALPPLAGAQVGRLSLTARGVHNYLTAPPQPVAS